jgi:hypothetical protein
VSAAKENCELLVCWDRQGKKTVETTQVSINAAYDNDPEESFRYLRFRVAEAKLSRQRPWRAMPCPSAYVIAGWVV